MTIGERLASCYAAAVFGVVYSSIVLAENPPQPERASPTNIRSPESLQSEPSAERPQIVWRKRMANGVDLGVVIEPATLDGKPVRSLSPYSVKPRDFANDDTYYGELPVKVRSDTNYVHFILHGTPRENPEEGTVLNIDGAHIGFIAHHDEKTGRDFAQLAVQDIGPNGVVQWVPAGMLLHPKPQQPVSMPKLAVGFDRKNNTWALYLKDVVIRDNLPLLSEGSTPTVSLRAGSVGDRARLLDLAIAQAPPPRGQRALRAINGRIDLKKEYEAGNPRIKASGLPQQ